jgi:endoglucanase
MIKKIFILVLLISFILETFAQSTPFNKGVNLTNWFQVNNPGQIQFTKYTKSDFEDIKSLGVDVIRLPINLHSMVTNTNDYELDPLFLKFLDEVVDWAEELEIHLILDNHTFNPSVSTDPNIKNILIPVWQNMAMYFKDRSNLIYFEILNEPHGVSDALWNTIQGEVISAIREIDTVRILIVGPSEFNSYHNLNAMLNYDDDNLIYTFHFYDPFIFTHQGASWTEPSMVSLENVPFPYIQSEMPPFPSDLVGTWIQSSFNNYINDGTIGKVRELLDIAANFKNQRGVPLFCGEFGVLMNNVDNNDRIFWYGIVRSYLESKGISWTTWDYHGAFGLFEEFGNDLFDHDLNIKLLESLGLNVPVQSELIINPDTTGFSIYSDYIGANIVNSSYNNGTLDFYSKNSTIGNYCIFWSSPSQYNSIGFRFNPLKDLTILLNQNYELGFWFKGDSDAAKFDLRFIDTKTSSEDHPWRMGYTIDNTNAALDNNWHYISIPLSSFQEYGSWDNETWFNPVGLFDWSSIDRLEIVNEHNVLSSTNLWFDEIRLFNPNITEVKGESIKHDYDLFQNYPNPFNASTIINYSLPQDGLIKLVIYNTLGIEISEVENGFKKAGIYSYNFDASKYASGVYYYVLKFENNFETKKMLLLK